MPILVSSGARSVGRSGTTGGRCCSGSSDLVGRALGHLEPAGRVWSATAFRAPQAAARPREAAKQG